MDSGRVLVVVLSDDWVHDIFTTPGDDFEEVEKTYMAAGFRVVHEGMAELQDKPGGSFALLPARPAQVVEMNDEETVYHAQGASSNVPIGG